MAPPSLPPVEHAVQPPRAGNGVEHREVREQSGDALGSRLGDERGQHVHADLQRLDAGHVGDDHAHALERLPAKRGCWPRPGSSAA